MKKFYRLLMLCTILSIASMCVLGQSNPKTVKYDEDEERDLYRRFLETWKSDQAAAFAVAKQYIEKFPSVSRQYDFVKKFARDYERALRKWHVKKLLLEQNVSEAFDLGKQILEEDPNDFDVLNTLAEGGLIAFSKGDRTFNADALRFAKQALQMVESHPDTGVGKLVTIGWLNLMLGVLSRVSEPAESRNYFRKFWLCEPFRHDPVTYSVLAEAVLAGEYYAIREEFNSTFNTPELKESPAARVMKQKLLEAMDFIIETLARAVAIAGSDLRFAALKERCMVMLTEFYKYRNSGYETGLPQLIRDVLNEPFPAYAVGP